jgi:hypothetical protein
MNHDQMHAPPCPVVTKRRRMRDGDISDRSSALAGPDVAQIFAANCGGALHFQSLHHQHLTVFKMFSRRAIPSVIALSMIVLAATLTTTMRPSEQLPAQAHRQLAPPPHCASSHRSRRDSSRIKSRPRSIRLLRRRQWSCL